MIPSMSFYSKVNRSSSKVTNNTTLHEVISHNASHSTTNVLLLPSQARDQAVDSDVEDIPDELINQNDTLNCQLANGSGRQN